ncbi:5'/3'-nucleotidase SurE [Stetteria hydrogenophila]
MAARARILVTNDDSYLSRGLYLLYESVKGLGEARIYSTEWPRSAVGRSVSFNMPLRLAETEFMGYRVYVTDGSPIDAFHLALGVHGFEPDLVVSGVNVGENLSLQHIFYSGTIAVALEAALMGIPAIAFSADVGLFSEFNDKRLSTAVRVVAGGLARHVLEEGMPEGVDVLSVNFPSPRDIRGCVKYTRAARRRWKPAFESRLDTRGRPYYWLQPIPVHGAPGTDVYTVLSEGCISVTPLRLDLNAQPASSAESRLRGMISEVESELREVLQRGPGGD